MIKINNEKAFVLHTRKFQENNLLVEAFTLNYGRVVVLARGRSKANIRAILQPFQVLLLSCRGKGEILSLTQIESLRHFLLTPRHILCGLYLNELLMRLMMRSDPHPALFLEYHKTLEALEILEATNTHKAEPCLRLFEKALLEAIGYKLPLTEDAVTGMPVLSDRLYEFDSERGPIYFESTKESRPVYTVKGKSLLALAAQELNDPEVLVEVKHLMRKALAKHLGNRPLESRRLF